ncbi:energy transducer TonB [Desulfotalea psychrophila]|uniref:Similar to TonB protein n=1 Tax=Desulfotalea psychrophila (strain LSv54 / DSM 12343) TaxID=177439 RepID=Q6AIY0_DESPS|nr:energy transducer TonB [Desulfotalea psychrophila]CAG37700.1 similar to TonB protein [Desulfotalea psychrophila LSv54]
MMQVCLRYGLALLGALLVTVVLCSVAPLMMSGAQAPPQEPISPIELMASIYTPPEKRKIIKREKVKPLPTLKKPLPRPPAKMEQIDIALAPLQMNLPAMQAASLPVLDISQGKAGLSGMGAGGIFDLANVDQAPKLLRYYPPLYPAKAKGQGVEGKVLVRCLVTATGLVRDAQIISADPPGYFERVSLKTVQRWKFAPARYQGKKVAVYVDIPLSFTLD